MNGGSRGNDPFEGTARDFCAVISKLSSTVTEATIRLRILQGSLLAALEDKEVRYQAAEALGKIGDPRAVEPLIVSLKDENAEVQWLAVEALEKIGTSEAIAAVQRVRDSRAR